MNKIKNIINNLKTPGETLSQKVLKGGFWVFFLRIINRGFSLVRLIILARILSPSDFGLMGIALLTMSTLETFSQTGFQAALIQKKEDIISYLNSAWTVLILRGFILFSILYFIAPYAALFFDAPEAKPIIRVIGLAILFRSFTNIGVTYFKKELEFNKEFIYQFAGTLADFIVALTAVLILKNVWALVFGLLAGNATRCIVSYLVHPYRPHLSSDIGKAKELFGFGKWIFLQTIILFLVTQGDDIFVGKVIGTSALGFYRLAYRLSNIAATEVTHVISQVTFPAYSKIQNNNLKLRSAIRKTISLISAITIPICGGLLILAPIFVNLFLGIKWLAIIPVIQILCLFAVIRSIGAIFGPIYKSKARMDLAVRFNMIQLIILAITIYPLSMKWGIIGTSLAVTLSALPVLYLSGRFLSKLIETDLVFLFKPIITPLLSTIIMIIVVFLLNNFLHANDLIKFILSVIFGISIYIGILLKFSNILSIIKNDVSEI